MCPKRQLWAVALGITLLTGGLLACGRPDLRSAADTGTPTASGARTSPQASRSSSPAGDETAAWMSYTSSAYGYTVKYPPGWFRPQSSDAQQNFSSEDAGVPLNLSPSGLWFYVLVTNATQADCPTVNAHHSTVSPNGATVDGVVGVRYDGAALVLVNVWRGRCYDFWFLVGSPDTLDAHRHVIDLILGSFRFGK
jgi:hypothetical protein